MSRLKPRKRDKIIAGFTEIDKKFNTTREDSKNKTIKELDDQMDNVAFIENGKHGFTNHKNVEKKMNKSYKGLRKKF